MTGTIRRRSFSWSPPQDFRRASRKTRKRRGRFQRAAALADDEDRPTVVALQQVQQPADAVVIDVVALEVDAGAVAAGRPRQLVVIGMAAGLEHRPGAHVRPADAEDHDPIHVGRQPIAGREIWSSSARSFSKSRSGRSKKAASNGCFSFGIGPPGEQDQVVEHLLPGGVFNRGASHSRSASASAVSPDRGGLPGGNHQGGIVVLRSGRWMDISWHHCTFRFRESKSIPADFSGNPHRVPLVLGPLFAFNWGKSIDDSASPRAPTECLVGRGVGGEGAVRPKHEVDFCTITKQEIHDGYSRTGPRTGGQE